MDFTPGRILRDHYLRDVGALSESLRLQEAHLHQQAATQHPTGAFPQPTQLQPPPPPQSGQQSMYTM